MTDVRRIVSENRRAIWILTAALVANAAVYALVLSPLAQRVQGQEQQAEQATRSLTAARRAHQAAQATVEGKQQAEAELTRFYGEILPPDMSGARRALYPHVDQLARNSNLTVSGSRINPDPEGRGELRKLTMTMSLSGEYTNIRRFIHDLETAPEFLVLESVNVSQAPQGRELNVTAQVATYYRTGGDGH
jgi:Tfp pilus assembly protein PilO